MHGDEAEITVAEFYLEVFGSLQPLIDAVTDHFEMRFGAEFDRKDVKWHEQFDSESGMQMYSLEWQDLTMISLQLSPYELTSECRWKLPRGH